MPDPLAINRFTLFSKNSEYLKVLQGSNEAEKLNAVSSESTAAHKQSLNLEKDKVRFYSCQDQRRGGENAPRTKLLSASQLAQSSLREEKTR